MDMVNDGVEDLRCKYITLIYTKYVSVCVGGRGGGCVSKGALCTFDSTLPLPVSEPQSQAGTR